RRQQPVAVRREAVVRPRAERAERFGRGPRRYPARPEGARGEPRGRALPDAFGRRAARSDRRLRARGGAAPLMLLAGRVGIVSGIGPGLGRAVALALAREGADVVLAARTAPALADVAAEVRVAGRHALGVPTDVTRPEQCRQLAEAAHGAFGRIDVLVNNAFRSGPYEPVAQATLDDWRKVFDVNLFGTLALCQAVIPFMKARGGSIVLLYSIVMIVIDPRFGGSRP